jgi:hypothetical protein
MTLFRVTGCCTKCNKFHKSEGWSFEDDAVTFFFQEHRADSAHWFEGEYVVSTYEEHHPIGPHPDWRKSLATKR